MARTKQAPSTDDWIESGQVPYNGARFVVVTRDGIDVERTVSRVWRMTDDPGVFTVKDSDGNTRWIQWDAVRALHVRAGGQSDGDPVPEPSIPLPEPEPEPQSTAPHAPA